MILVSIYANIEDMENIYIITLMDTYFNSLLTTGVIGKALQNKNINLNVHILNPRNFTTDQYKNVDDTPYGGGAGMVLRSDVLANCLNQGVLSKYTKRDMVEVIYFSPRGKKITQKMAKHYSSSKKDLVLICGRYEGIDERFIENYVDTQVCLGDFVLSGGEIAAMAFLDASLRLVPGVLGNRESLEEESFEDNLLEYPLYTKPREFEGKHVPEVL